MKHLCLIITFLAAAAFNFSPAGAYVLHPDHLLDLMTKKLGKPKRLYAEQDITHFETAPSRTVSGDKPVPIKEKVSYKLPERFRSDIKNETSEKVYVFAAEQVIKVINGKRTSSSETWQDYYKDLLLYRNRELLHDRLAGLGVDVSVSSLGRFQKKLFFIIGAKYPDESVSQVWIDKDTFRPARWLITRGETDKNKMLEIRYNNWQVTKKTWYPTRIEFYSGNSMIQLITVTKVIVNPSFSKDIFNIKQMHSIYPHIADEKSTKPANANISDVQRITDDFGELVEH